MNILRIPVVSWATFSCIFIWSSMMLSGQELKSGALILVSKSGDVSFDFMVLPLNLKPKVPIEAAGKLLIFKI